MIVDDFLTGPGELARDDSRTLPGHATGTILGSQRRTRLGYRSAGQRASLSIGPGPSSTGRLLVSLTADNYYGQFLSDTDRGAYWNDYGFSGNREYWDEGFGWDLARLLTILAALA